MGRIPMPMTPLPLSYPAEWLLDVFSDSGRSTRPRRAYAFEIKTPPMPWMLREIFPGLQNGWSCMLLTVAVGEAIAYAYR